MPQARYRDAGTVPLNKYGCGPFCKFKIPWNISLSGVYALVVGKEAQYVGECTNLSSRFNMGYGNISPCICFLGGQGTTCRVNNLILKKVKTGLDVDLWFHETKDQHPICPADELFVRHDERMIA